MGYHSGRKTAFAYYFNNIVLPQPLYHVKLALRVLDAVYAIPRMHTMALALEFQASRDNSRDLVLNYASHMTALN